MQYSIVSADSHINEPPELFNEVPASLRSLAPQLVHTDKGDAWIMAPGAAPRFVSTSAVAGRKKEEYLARPVTYETMRKGSFMPGPHVEDMDIDNIDAGVLYPGIMRYLERCADGPVRLACAHTYNEWMAGFQKHDPKRLVGIATLPQLDDDMGKTTIEALERAAKLGLRGAFLSQKDSGIPLHHPDASRFWAVAEEIGIPISIHIHTNPFQRGWSKDWMDIPGSKELGGSLVLIGMAEHMNTLIWGGVVARHPKLKIVLAEGGIGWIPSVLERMDHVYDVHRHYMNSIVKEKPSETFRKNFYATFQKDVAGIRLRDMMGADRLMWASDYPHTDTTWPESKKVIDETFEGVPEGDKHLMISENAARLYGLQN